MELAHFLILQIIAHLLADFFLQTQAQSENKNRLGFRSPFLKWHVVVVFSLSWILSFQLNFIIGAAIIALTHYIIDGLKKQIYNHQRIAPSAFFIDQALHIIIIVLTVKISSQLFDIKPIFDFSIEIKYLAIIAGYLVCLKPSNVFIKQVFIAFSINVTDDEDLPNAGKLIGILERFLVLTFVIFNQFEAVGFLIAAKSILRYKGDETVKTEYVLIGTMLSFGIAIGIGIAITLI